MKERNRIGCRKLEAGQFHFARTGPNDFCTPVCFRNGSSWPQPDKAIQNQIKTGRFGSEWLSGCGKTDPVRKKSGVQKSSGLVLAKRNRPASSVPHPIRFRSSKVSLSHTVRNQPRSDLDPDGCQVVAKLIQSRRKPVCKNHPALFWQNEPARYQFLTSDSVLFFQRWYGLYCAKPARITDMHARTDTDGDYHLFCKVLHLFKSTSTFRGCGGSACVLRLPQTSW